MKYLILIDKKSIKRNPNAGSQVTKMFGAREIDFECDKLPDILIDEKNCFISTYKVSNKGVKSDITGYLDNDDLIEELLTNKRYKDCNITINVHNNIETINHFPIPKYSFKYTPLKVKCNECGHEFMSNEFLSMSNDDDDEYRSTVTGCPKCNEYDCCDVRYQNIKEIEHELKL